MEQGRGLRSTTNRLLLFVAVVVLVLLAFASALGEEDMDSETREAGQTTRDWVALLIVPLTLAGADINQEQLDLVRSLQGTVMPDGSTHP